MEDAAIQTIEKPKKRKMTYRIRWTVNPYRKDKRTGVVNPGPRDPYTTYAFKEIERAFRK
ncbi:hypothetical protein [Cytobacillus firmus]|uniref:hypothetical protein n=1 Tax=Cytobacillus firmus TaxID=1399 RepID=UPI0018CE36EB|nr:hypothetical protein [Cytobacillus firmus]MBG9548400.1 hypothetical protein [Cytobacillus firmus]MBG9604508.1 hypothetical protein [Cytobacillus firmus]MED1942122.1 hypothetical protein [Cytobacillus firmus]